MPTTHRLALAVVTAATACAEPPAPSTIAFDLDGPLGGETYWNLPFPSDLRLTADGRPDLAGFPNDRGLPVVVDLLSSAAERRGFPVMPIAWFRFTGDVPAHALADTLRAEAAAPALLVDIDPASPERGALYPLVAQTLVADGFTGGDGLVALAPRPGITLRGDTRYAYVLRAAFAPGVAAPEAFRVLASGEVPGGARGAAAAELYAPLWPTLEELGVDDAIAATVFTTGDEVALLRARSEAVRGSATAAIADLRVRGMHADYCALAASVTVPQYQVGAQPFDSAGRFAFDGAGAPIAQGEMTIPLAITIPRGAMPASGWPLWQFFHGSGGASFDLVDDGPSASADAAPAAGEGPGAVVARRGIAAASSALPLNPERLPGASNYAYLNLANLAAFPYTFQQGVFEQRLLLDALLALRVPAALASACGLPAVEQRFDPAGVVAGGHSMGGMYTNMIGAVEPRHGALVPFGAGGFWNMMILDTEIVPGARGLLAGTLGVDPDHLTFVHPALALIGLGWEIAEPGAAMARLARRPLPGHSARHVYQPVGMDDKFFPNPVFDAAALAYGNREAGEVVWPTTQDALAVEPDGSLHGVMPYPVRANRGGPGRPSTTSVVVQYRDDGILDAHYIHRQLPAVRYQYGCFLATYLRDGIPTVPAPPPAGPGTDRAACP